ncbi:VanZ family protein [Amycolatopsis umgeniensis]|uniref:VanZ-like domain-containing protein n=1 Tax=Amycolatopsis umgeniensis TaxID=336628 RepID=A0A841ATP2_9PSEU|nr:VanZ family protein [Amycolatopsis umgeniensis]MBB5851256.1 hypothetical protein [Amycolatopsis umgeniensis]
MGWLWRAFCDAAPSALIASATGAGLLRLVHRRTQTLLVTALDFALLTALSAVLLVVFLPPPGNWHSPPMNLNPLADVGPTLHSDVALFQAVGNVALLIPLAILLPLRFAGARSIPRVALLALSLSGAIECLQVLFDDGRVGTFDDIVFNTAGAALGARLSRFRWREPTPAPARVALWRRSDVEVQRITGGGRHLIGRALLHDLPPLADGATLEITLSESHGGTLVVSARASMAA